MGAVLCTPQVSLQPEEGLLKVVIGLCQKFEILQVLLLLCNPEQLCKAAVCKG